MSYWRMTLRARQKRTLASMGRALLLFALFVSCRRYSPLPPKVEPSTAPVAEHVTYDERPLAASAGPILPMVASLAIGELHDALWVGDALWVASSSGLVLFDDPFDIHRAPRVLGPRDGLPSAEVSAVALVRGEVWAATDRGVARLDLDGRVLGASLSGRARGVYADGSVLTDRGIVRDGRLVAAHDGALVAVQCRGWHFGDELGVPASVLRCHEGKLYAGTPLGLFVNGRRAFEGHVTAIAFGQGHTYVGTLARGVRQLDGSAIVERGRAWVVAASGALLATFAERTLTVTRGGMTLARSLDGPRGLVTALQHDGDTLWVGTFDDGLYRYAGGRYEGVPLRDPRVDSLALVGNDLWIGTATGLLTLDGPIVDERGWLRHYIGPMQSDGERIRVDVFPGYVELDARSRAVVTYRSGKADEPGDGLPLFGTNVNGSARSGDHVWLATLEGLEVVSDDRTRVLGAVTGALPDDWVNDITTVGDDAWFLLGDRGFGRVRGNRVSVWRAPIDSNSSTLKRIGGALVFAASGALFVVRPNDAAVMRFDVLPFALNALDYDVRNDRLWLGGRGGVARLDHAATFFAGALAGVTTTPLYSEVP